MSKVATVTLFNLLPTVVVAYPVIKGFFVKIIIPRVSIPGRADTKVYVKKLILRGFIASNRYVIEIYALWVVCESGKRNA